jgi:hypothetical protein
VVSIELTALAHRAGCGGGAVPGALVAGAAGAITVL